MKLYTYYRSSASYRVRIALALKQLDAEYHFVDLKADEQYSPNMLAVNPQGLVPVLDDNGLVVNQSLSILEYLEERYSKNPLLPKHTSDRTYVRSLMYMIACEAQPFGNVKPLNYLARKFSASPQSIEAWGGFWIQQCFDALEEKLTKTTLHGQFCFGDVPTLADVCLIPQAYNAQRFGVELSSYPNINNIYNHCLQLESFSKTAPDQQKDAPASTQVSV